MEIVEVPFDSPLYLAAVALRRAVLRVPLGLEFKPEDLAREGAYRHLVALEAGVVIGCLMIVSEPEAARIRQMAVRPDRQGQGIGRALMLAAEREIIALGKTQILLHAREHAIGFYEKLGYRKEGERFLEVTLGHWAMRKLLPARD